MLIYFHREYPEAYALEQTLLVQKIATEHHGSDFVFVEELDAKEELWKVSQFFHLNLCRFPSTHLNIVDFLVNKVVFILHNLTHA